MFTQDRKASRFLYVRQRLKQSRGLCLPFCSFDANIRANWYTNVMLSGRQPCSKDLGTHEKEQTALAQSTMKIKKELPDSNIIVSPNVSVVWNFRTDHLSTLQKLW